MPRKTKRSRATPEEQDSQTDKQNKLAVDAKVDPLLSTGAPETVYLMVTYTPEYETVSQMLGVWKWKQVDLEILRQLFDEDAASALFNLATFEYANTFSDSDEYKKTLCLGGYQTSRSKNHKVVDQKSMDIRLNSIYEYLGLHPRHLNGNVIVACTFFD